MYIRETVPALLGGGGLPVPGLPQTAGCAGRRGWLSSYQSFELGGCLIHCSWWCGLVRSSSLRCL